MSSVSANSISIPIPISTSMFASMSISFPIFMCLSHLVRPSPTIISGAFNAPEEALEGLVRGIKKNLPVDF